MTLFMVLHTASLDHPTELARCIKDDKNSPEKTHLGVCSARIVKDVHAMEKQTEIA